MPAQGNKGIESGKDHKQEIFGRWAKPQSVETSEWNRCVEIVGSPKHLEAIRVLSGSKEVFPGDGVSTNISVRFTYLSY